MVCELQDKHNVLWAFIKAHLKVCFPTWLPRAAFHTSLFIVPLTALRDTKYKQLLDDSLFLRRP